MISYEHKFIFVHIPRTAGTSIEEYLCGFESSPLDLRRQFLPGCRDGRQHLYLEELLDHRDLTNDFPRALFKFSVVRNPWDWYLSVVRYWIRRGYLDGSESHFKRTFFDLLEVEQIDNHRIRSQLDYLTIDGSLAVDFVARFESLDKDIREVGKCIGIEANRPLPCINSSPNGSLPYWMLYDEEMKEAVAERYSRDITTFEYKFEEEGVNSAF